MSHSISFEQPGIAADDVEIPEQPDEIFDRLVADASRVCQQCFRRLRSRRRFPHKAGLRHGDTLAFVDFDLPAHEPGWNAHDREYYEHDQEPDRVERMTPPGDADSATGCAHCGAVEPHRSPSTRPRSETINAALGISATLHELGVAHNPLVLLVEVAELKRDPELAGDDCGVFAKATSRAVRAGRGDSRCRQ